MNQARKRLRQGSNARDMHVVPKRNPGKLTRPAVSHEELHDTGVSPRHQMDALHRAAAQAGNPADWIKLLDDGQPNAFCEMLAKATGVEGRPFLIRLFVDAAGASDMALDRDTLHETAAAFVSLRPTGAAQAMLAAQMVGVHRAAMRALVGAASREASFETVELKTNRATRLMRVYLQQAELMARLQGSITSQKVVVERVDIQPGSQAVVGVVEAGKTRGEG